MIKEQFTKHKAGWKRSFLEGISQDEHGNFLPWMTYPAIEFLQNNITENHRIFEFGCGASTVFFAKIAKEVFGVETNKKWLSFVKIKLLERKISAKITLMEDGIDNEAYENLPEKLGGDFDVIVIDSIKRFACAKAAINSIKENGMIILDDAQRENYQKIFDFFAQNNFKKIDFEGIEPGKLKLKKTTIFLR